MVNKTSYYDADIKAAIGIFKGFVNSDEFKRIAEDLHQVRIDNRSNKQLNNIEDMKVLTVDIREWLKDVWFPRAIETGLKYFAFVVPKDLVGSLSMKDANEEAQFIPDMEIKYFDNETSAREWLKSKDS